MCNYNGDKKSESEIGLVQAYINVKNIDTVLSAYGQLVDSPSVEKSPNILTMRLLHMKLARDSEAANIKQLSTKVLEEQYRGGNCLFCIIKQLVAPT